MKKYEGLFILNTGGKEEGIKDAIDRISADIAAAGCTIETVQKMDKRAFSRVSDKKHTSGFYVNVIFEGEPSSIALLQNRFSANNEVFRVLVSAASTPKQAA